ncbi:MAG: Ger(x)C family spore germination protein [Clostridiaceae bacterium]|nr:Ger(x)C family spore germination protein [Clostridiaceae bacterium]
MTIQLPVLRKTEITITGGGGNSGDADSKTWEITQIGNSFMDMSMEMMSRTSLSLYYEHLQVIVISEEVAKIGLEDVTDFFTREPEMRRRVKVFICPGQAKSILDVQPRIEDYSAIYLAMLPMNATRNSRVIYKTDLGEVISNIHEGNDFVLPRIISIKDEIKASGGAVFKKDKMVGWLNEIELEGYKFVRNTYQNGVITVKIPNKERGIASMEISNAKSKITPIIEDGNVRFDVEIKVKGNYAENVDIHTHGELNDSFLNSLETEFAKEIEKICMQTIERMQKEYGADIFRFGNVLRYKEPAYWKNVSNRWDSIFPNVDIQVKADVSIILSGIVK